MGVEFVFKTILMEDNLSLYNEMGGDSLVGFMIVLLASSFLIYSAIVTNCMAKFTKSIKSSMEAIEKYVKSLTDKKPKKETAAVFKKNKCEAPNTKQEVIEGGGDTNENPIEILGTMNCLCEITTTDSKQKTKKNRVNFRIADHYVK